MKPFLVPSVSPFLTSGPPALTSAAYARDLNEVKAVGAANSTVRTPDQTDAASWWHDRHLTEWEIKRQLAAGQHLDVLQAARMFAMVDLAQADAAIVCAAMAGRHPSRATAWHHQPINQTLRHMPRPWGVE